ncbi:ribonuclease R [bacterium]|nr:MAG: ribonuclease R [bacterium]
MNQNKNKRRGRAAKAGKKRGAPVDARQAVTAILSAASKRPVSFNDIARSLNIGEKETGPLKNLLSDMEQDGSLIRISGNRYGLAVKLNLVTGEFICHPDGFGFVKPESGEGEDVFIGPRKLGGAMHGDIVVSRVEGVKDKGRREGSIIRVLKRARTSVVGRFVPERGYALVVPSDARIIDPIIIPPSESNGAEDGLIVEAEITRWPSKGSGAAGKVIKVIGRPESPDVEVEVILKKYGLANLFPPAVEFESKGVPLAVSPADIKGRVDLRGKLTVTIDGETAKDFDDAVSIERTTGGWRLFVSIADVSHYVTPLSPIDIEAYARGTSVYFPDRCIPMLPEALSNGICSLNPKVDRLALTAEMEFNSDGHLVKKKFYESVIKSAERMTYTAIKKLLSGEDTELNVKYNCIINDIKLMEELALLLSALRTAAGSIDFDLPEPQIIIDIEGKIENIARSERNIAHRIIEEFMLSANRAVASEFSSRGLPFLYRVHASPSEESINDFKEFIAGLGLVIKSKSGAPGPKAFQSLLEEVKGTVAERLVNHVLLRSMKQAIYSDENIGHFGLAFDDYTHFTSPIRRYPDLVVHRLLKLLLRSEYGKKERDRMTAELPAITAHASARERKAMEAEREIIDLKKCQFMKDKEGEAFDGFISGVASFGFFVELKEYFVEALVRVSSLADDYYTFDEKRHTLIGSRTKRTFRLADPVRVKISRVDLERRRIDAELDGEAFTKSIAPIRPRQSYKGRARKRN